MAEYHLKFADFWYKLCLFAESLIRENFRVLMATPIETQKDKTKKEKANRKGTSNSQLCRKESKVRGAIHHKCSNHIKLSLVWFLNTTSKPGSPVC